MPTFSPRANTASLIASRPSIGIMLMLSVPAAIMMSASPVRMRSAAIDTALSPDEQKRLIVMPATLLGSPASSTPMRATFMPCSYSGIAQPTITSSTRADRCAGACASTLRKHVREQRVGARRPEGAARRLADRGARRGNDVGVLHLLGHACVSLNCAAACRWQACARCAPASARRAAAP